MLSRLRVGTAATGKGWGRALTTRLFSSSAVYAAPGAEIYPIPPTLLSGAHIRGPEHYQRLYAESLADPEAFWKKMAHEHLDWLLPFGDVRRGSFRQGHVEWFLDGKLNASLNCIDRHLATKSEQPAIIWQADDPHRSKVITYQELATQTSKLANLLLSEGVTRGDKVTLYMPMVPEAVYAMLACARIGAIHNVVFAGFSAEALRARIQDSQSKVVITAEVLRRGGKHMSLTKTVHEAVNHCPSVKRVLILENGPERMRNHWHAGRDESLLEGMERQRPYCPAAMMDSEDPLFYLYTSGSTGKPKGLVHTTAGYLLYTALTHKYAFDYRPGEVYACVADIGWITGHSYIVYGPLLNGATTVLFEGLPTHPNPSRYWELVEKFRINSFYTAPTALRSLMKFGAEPVRKHDRSSLRVLGSVGEPINPEAWKWYYEVVGEKRCAIVDTYWQTETGGVICTPLPGATPMKPGSCSKPFFGIDLAILDPATGKPAVADSEGSAKGVLAVMKPWPGIARAIAGDNGRYKPTYFESYPGAYFTGDGATKDADGYYWITGRVDDVINKAGHRIGTAEIESALVSHRACAEAAVVAIPDEVKGEAIVAFCSLKQGFDENEDTVSELKREVRRSIGAIAVPDYVVVTHTLPKTRSGKIMRRVLRKVAQHQTDQASLGDVSTLADQQDLVHLIARAESSIPKHSR